MQTIIMKFRISRKTRLSIWLLRLTVQLLTRFGLISLHDLRTRTRIKQLASRIVKNSMKVERGKPASVETTTHLQQTINMKNTPQQNETPSTFAENDLMLKQAGWTDEHRKMMQQDNAQPPGYMKAIKHIRDMGNLAHTALQNLSNANKGNTIDNKTEPQDDDRK